MDSTTLSRYKGWLIVVLSIYNKIDLTCECTHVQSVYRNGRFDLLPIKRSALSPDAIEAHCRSYFWEIYHMPSPCQQLGERAKESCCKQHKK